MKTETIENKCAEALELLSDTLSKDVNSDINTKMEDAIRLIMEVRYENNRLGAKIKQFTAGI